VKLSILGFLLGAALFCSVCNAQSQRPKEITPTPPATKLEEFSGRTGTVVVRGYSTVGEIDGLGSVTIDAREFRDAGEPKLRQTGLSIAVKESGHLERESTSFVDYDEIESLLRGIDYISKIDRSVTSLKEFEAEYRTRGDFRITTFSSQGGSIRVAISSGRIGPASAYFKLSDLTLLRTFIVNAKAMIDATK